MVDGQYVVQPSGWIASQYGYDPPVPGARGSTGADFVAVDEVDGIGAGRGDGGTTLLGRSPRSPVELDGSSRTFPPHAIGMEKAMQIEATASRGAIFRS